MEEPDGDYRAFSIEDANFIMEAFEEQMCLTNNLGAPWDQVVKFLFTLIEQRKISQYLTPYATRHTYINAQLDAGVRAADIAKRVGNSVATIHKYYESARRKTSVMSVEI